MGGMSSGKKNKERHRDKSTYTEDEATAPEVPCRPRNVGFFMY